MDVRQSESQERIGQHELIILRLNDTRMHDIARVGGKAASLAELSRIPGIHVPPALVITSLAYATFLTAHPEIETKLEQLEQLTDPKDIQAQAQAIYQAIRAAPMPTGLQEVILTAYHELSRAVGEEAALVSVRSSATAEDMPTASFAGQYETYLNQRGQAAVLDTVRLVWASTYNLNAVQYHNERGLRHRVTKMAVIIQQMVDARAAGTAFTVDLETGVPMISIHATYGLGEAEVGGVVTPDTWIVDPETLTLVKRRLGNKVEKIILDTGTGKSLRQGTTEHERSTYAIDLSTARQLAQKVKAIGEYYHAKHGVVYVDTEFAIDQQGAVFFLQARPETVWARHKPDLIAVDLRHAAGMQRGLEGGVTGSPGVVTGALRVVTSPGESGKQEAERRVRPGDILVVANTTNIWEGVLRQAGGAITDIGGPGSHTAVVMREWGKPALVGTHHATRVLQDYDDRVVTLDATQKIIFLDTVPSAWLYTPTDLRATHGALGEETEEQAWDQATRTGQTQTDPQGGRWIGKPNYLVSPFMQEIYLACHQWMGARLGAPVRAHIQGKPDGRGIHLVDFHDVFQWQVRLDAMTLEELEALHRERLETVSAYLHASAWFALTPDAVLEWLDQYLRMNAFMSVAYNIHRVTERLLENALSHQQVPWPYSLQVRPAMGALLGETEATLSLRDYQALLERVRDDHQLRQVLRSAEETGVFDQLNRINPEFAARLHAYAFRYKITDETDPTLSSMEPLRAVVHRLNRDAAEHFQVHITHATPEEFYPEDERFGRIVRLALESEKARQDAHHQKIRGQWIVCEKVQPLADFLICNRELSRYEELFSHPPDWLLRQVIHYRLTHWLESFYGRVVDVPPVPASISMDTYRVLRSWGFELFYLPALEVTHAEEVKRYPGWQYPLAERYWATEIVERVSLPGQWIAVELLGQPSVQGMSYDYDRLMQAIGEGSRFLSWDVIHASILPKIAAHLKLAPARVRLPYAIEWNFLGNLLRYLRQQGEDLPDWGATASWEWTEGKYGRYHRLLVGKHGAEGLDGLQAVGWVFSGDEWYRIFGFRTLLVF